MPALEGENGKAADEDAAGKGKEKVSEVVEGKAKIEEMD